MDISINGARVLAEIQNVPLLGTVQITQTLVVAYVVMAIITGLVIWLGSGLTVTGISRKQAVAEMGYNAIVNFVRGNMGPNFDHYIPLVCTIFISSVVSNLIGLIGFWSPTADLMTELAWALVVFVLITYHKIKSAGFGAYLKGFLDPIFVMAPINVMSECFTPISMACRHFGNILSGTVISTLVYGALTAANNALFGALSSSVVVAAIVAVARVVLFFVGKKISKTLFKVLGIIMAVLGVLAVITNLGAQYPWLPSESTVGMERIRPLVYSCLGL